MTLTLNRQLLTSRQILVAFSGGLDSTVLLHQLVQWRTENPGVTLRAIHVHHGLSANADAWVTHCENVCQQWQVPLVVERVQLAQEGLGIEAQARQARYQAFARTLLPGEVLVTAQHLDDQCETFLLALKRGSGPAGLSAMAEVSEFAGTRLIRPLLARTRGELEQWALAHGLRWIEDESNQDDSYDRNFLRLRVVPLLQQRWPHFAEATARSAALCAEQESLLDELLADDLAHCQTSQGTLQIAPMLAMSDARRAAIIRRWLAGQNAPMPSRDALVRIWQEVALARKMPPPVYAWARLKSAAISRNCGGLNPSPGKVKPLCRGRRGYNRWNYRRGWEAYSLLREAIFALRVQTKRSACVSKRQDCCILSGATADVS